MVTDFLFSEEKTKMSELDRAREIINEVDKEMAKLFCRRMEAVKTVARYKQERGLPVLDSAREAAVIERNSRLVEDDELRPYYVNFITSNMEISRAFQHRILEGMRVAYSGVPGAFANIAAKRIFPDGTAVAYPDFKSAYDSIERGECDCAVLPIENSHAGDVTQVMDLAFFGSLHLTGIYDLQVVQNLLGVPGSSITQIKRVISHQQALDQCAEYIRNHGFIPEGTTNTAVAAKQVAINADPTVAAIASMETAKLYGLHVLERNINESSVNTTRFAVFSKAAKAENSADKHFFLFFTVKNEAGCLAKAINAIGDAGFNMRALKSRPTKELIWEYYFTAEVEGNAYSENGKAMLKNLEEICSSVKVLGTYDKELQLKG